MDGQPVFPRQLKNSQVTIKAGAFGESGQADTAVVFSAAVSPSSHLPIGYPPALLLRAGVGDYFPHLVLIMFRG